MRRGEERNFKRYFAPGPSGMPPLGCGSHQPPPNRSAAASGGPARLAPREDRSATGNAESFGKAAASIQV